MLIQNIEQPIQNEIPAIKQIDKLVTIVFHLSKENHKKYKSIAKENGITWSKFLLNAIESYEKKLQFSKLLVK